MGSPIFTAINDRINGFGNVDCADQLGSANIGGDCRAGFVDDPIFAAEGGT